MGDQRFYGAADAARYAAQFADRFRIDTGEIWDAERLIGVMEYADTENPLDAEYTPESYYVVDETGTVGFTEDDGETVSRIAVPDGAAAPQSFVQFCPFCGAQMPREAVFCGECGARLSEEEPQGAARKPETGSTAPQTTPPASAPAAPAKEKAQPRARSSRKQEDRPPPFLMRVLLILCAAILFCVTSGSLLVSLIGREADAEILDTTIYKQLEDNRSLYVWDVTYAFYAGGERYIDTDQLTGPQSGVNTFGCHVSYLAFAPEISRLTWGNSFSELTNAKDRMAALGSALLQMAIGLFCSYLLLFIAFPRLPFFGFGGRKKKKKRKKKAKKKT